MVPPQLQNKEISEVNFTWVEGATLEIIRPKPYHYNNQRRYQSVNKQNNYVNQRNKKPPVIPGG
jgi:hypothetical protein